MIYRTGRPRIYLDHAATSFPKPPGVISAVQSYMSVCGASAGRGAYREAFEAKQILDETRASLASLFNISNPQRIIFTLNATDALNLALKGVLKSGDHVLTSSLEHNSISRPLLTLQERENISFTKVKVSLDGAMDWNEFEKAIRPNTKLMAFIHGSNVSGTLTPIAEISERARKKGIPLLVDAAQTAGAFPIDVESLKIDLLAMPGHKALLGPLGTGALWVRDGIELKTFRQGGTGSASEEDRQPSFWPDAHESGSHNLPGLAGLKVASDFLKKEGIQNIRKHKVQLLQQFYEGLKEIKNMNMIAPQDPLRNAGVVSLQFENKDAQSLALQLDENFRIQGRPGLHCAPWAHETFQTLKTGTLRLSFGYFNRSSEIEAALSALSQV